MSLFSQPSLGYLEGQAMRDNPDLLKRYFADQDNQRRAEYMNGLMGSAAVPQETEPFQAEYMEGEELQPQGLMNITQEAQDGTGYLGGLMGDKELAMRMLQAPTQTTRTVGGSLLNQLLKPQGQEGVSFNDFQNMPLQQQKQFQMFKGRNGPTSAQQNLVAAGLQPGTKGYQNAMLKYINKPQTQLTMGGVPAGSERVIDPSATNNSGVVLRPLKGSENYNKAVEGYLGAGAGVKNVEEMIKLITKHGSETFGETAGTMGALYGQILATVAELQNKGVLQQGEMEMIQSQLTDPTSGTGLTTSTSKMMSQYGKLLELLKDRQSRLGTKFKAWDYDLPKAQESSETIGNLNAQDSSALATKVQGMTQAELIARAAELEAEGYGGNNE